jgi:uncharacterized protein YndB with AHSA1/START domain
MGHDTIAQKRALRLAGLTLLACGYAQLARPPMARWGATDGEVADAMPGDGEVPEPQFAVTRAVTIAAPPEAVWPWIVQIGYHRAGWYAHDLFDNDDIPSAEAILPEFQHLQIGQGIGEEGFAVRELEPGRHLVLAFGYPKTEWVIKQGLWPKFGHCSMCLQLRPVHGGDRTRLLYRVRLSAPPVGRAVMAAFFEPADFIQSRKMLTGIKRRAETHHAGAVAAAHQAKAGAEGIAR